jgi:hypothetical protein
MSLIIVILIFSTSPLFKTPDEGTDSAIWHFTVGEAGMFGSFGSL